MAPENASANLAASRNGAPAAARQPQEMRGVHALVKWESPADEVRGIAAGAAVLLRDHAVLPHQIGFAVPNRTWAVQLAQACKVMGVRASIVVPAKLNILSSGPESETIFYLSNCQRWNYTIPSLLMH